MSTNTGDQNGLVQTLSDEKGAITNAISLGKWVKTAPFVTFEKYEVCADNPGLVDNSQKFRKSVEGTLIKESTTDVRITALRFKQTAAIPMKAGSTVDLIPIAMSRSVIPYISNTELKVGHYVHLTNDEAVTLELQQSPSSDEAPELYCVLLLSQ